MNITYEQIKNTIQNDWQPMLSHLATFANNSNNNMQQTPEQFIDEINNLAIEFTNIIDHPDFKQISEDTHLDTLLVQCASQLVTIQMQTQSIINNITDTVPDDEDIPDNKYEICLNLLISNTMAQISMIAITFENWLKALIDWKIINAKQAYHLYQIVEPSINTIDDLMPMASFDFQQFAKVQK